MSRMSTVVARSANAWAEIFGRKFVEMTAQEIKEPKQEQSVIN